MNAEKTGSIKYPEGEIELFTLTNRSGSSVMLYNILYTGNWLSGSPAGIGGRSYNRHDGVAIECQGIP